MKEILLSMNAHPFWVCFCRKHIGRNPRFDREGHALGRNWEHWADIWDIKQTLCRHWADTGQTLGRHWADTGQTLGRQWADIGQTLGRQWAEIELILGKHWADIGISYKTLCISHAI